MSMIHRSCALVGRRSSLISGTARCSTVRSITYSTHARAITPSPIQSRRVAFGGSSTISIPPPRSVVIAVGPLSPGSSSCVQPRSTSSSSLARTIRGDSRDGLHPVRDTAEEAVAIRLGLEPALDHRQQGLVVLLVERDRLREVDGPPPLAH